MNTFTHFFSVSYSHARQRFLDAALAQGLAVETHVLEGYSGLEGEALATDVVRLGPDNAKHLLVLTSATHGVEGFCGSACQLAVLHDTPLRGLLHKLNVAVLIVHATNPYGFSYLSRTTEDNIDLNRNSIDFLNPLPENPAYDEIHSLLIPQEWPPTPSNAKAIEHYIATRGEGAYQAAVTTGQFTHSMGMFYGGKKQGWSTQTLNKILAQYGAGHQCIAWIDFHTGLGPCGHGEKICVGRVDAKELQRARAWWGADVTSPIDGTTVASNVAGPVSDSLRNACPNALFACIALEYGTVPLTDMLHALRADMWLRSHPEATSIKKQMIRGAIRDTFYCENDFWRGQVLAQGRVATLQAILGMAQA